MRITRRVSTSSTVVASLWLAAGMALFAGSAPAADPAAGRALAAELGCHACHGEDGFGVDADTPHMAGQDKTYLMRQLAVFANPGAADRKPNGDSVRYHGAMESVTRRLTYAQQDLLASFYASLSCIPTSVPDADDVPTAVKPCAQCHGLYGVNIEPGIPVLAGQKRAYIERQLEAFRAARFGPEGGKQEQLRDQRLMSEHAAALTDADIGTIGEYFAALRCR